MVDLNISGANWVDLPRGTYAIRRPANKVSTAKSRQTLCTTRSSHTRPSATGPGSRRSMPRRLKPATSSASSARATSPAPPQDPVIQIAAVLQEQGQRRRPGGQSLPFEMHSPSSWRSRSRRATERRRRRHDVASASCAPAAAGPPHAATTSKSSTSEDELLDRAETLAKQRGNSALREFPYWDRRRRSAGRSQPRAQFQSAAYGAGDIIDYDMAGSE